MAQLIKMFAQKKPDGLNSLPKTHSGRRESSLKAILYTLCVIRAHSHTINTHTQPTDCLADYGHYRSYWSQYKS